MKRPLTILLTCFLLSSCTVSLKSSQRKKERAETALGLAFAVTVLVLVAGQYGKSVSP